MVLIGCHEHLLVAVTERCSLKFNSENTEILYLLITLKEPVQIDCKKACSVMEQA